MKTVNAGLINDYLQHNMKSYCEIVCEKCSKLLLILIWDKMFASHSFCHFNILFQYSAFEIIELSVVFIER